MHSRNRKLTPQPLWQYLLSLIVVCGSLSMNGCAGGLAPAAAAVAATNAASNSTAASSTTTTTGSTAGSTTTGGPAAVSANAALASIASVTNFGDSITCGYYATPNDGSGYMYSMEGYATQLDTRLGVPAQYLCRGGDQAADMAKLWVYPNTQPELGKGQLFTVMIGTNDAHFCGIGEGCIANWSAPLAASLAWLALPASDKVMASQMNASGAWKPDLAFGGSDGSRAEATSQAGATLRFAVRQAVAGRSLYVAYRVFDANVLDGGTATVSVDGVVAATLRATVETGHVMATQNGETDTIFVAAIPMGAAGEHAVTIATTALDGASSGGFFSVLWAGVSSGNYAEVAGAPTVAVGTVPVTAQAQLNGWVDQYNTALGELVAALKADGMNIVTAPTGTALSESDLVDLLHPANAGHAKLAAAFESVLLMAPPAQVISLGP